MDDKTILRLIGIGTIYGIIGVFFLLFYIIIKIQDIRKKRREEKKKQQNPLWRSVFSIEKLISEFNDRKAKIEKLLGQRKSYIDDTIVKIAKFKSFYQVCLGRNDKSFAVLIMSQVQFLEAQVQRQQAIVNELKPCLEPLANKVAELKTRKGLLEEFLITVSETLPTNAMQEFESQAENKLIAEIDTLLEKADEQKMLHDSVIEVEGGLTDGQIQARIESFNAYLKK